MKRETYKSMVAAVSVRVQELMPWDLVYADDTDEKPLLLDIRCPHEFDAAHIDGSINVPRGLLEMAVDYGYEETVPELVEARTRPVVVICRSGYRSILAAHTLQCMGYSDVASLRTGLRGWNDYEQPLYDGNGRCLDPDNVDEMFSALIPEEKRGPQAA